MSSPEAWGWPALFLLGAYHGINPGMGWLFAVALGMQQKSRRAVGRSLGPIALGHALATGVVVLAGALLHKALPSDRLQPPVAALLCGFGVYRLLRHRHPRWGGMQAGFRDLTIWSFLMASAHGAGFMLLPVLLSMHGNEHSHAMAASQGSWMDLLAVAVHTLGYLLITALVALLVYEKLGLALLRKAWLNLDLIWAAALIATGLATLLI
jgi:hypothetical protein